MATEGSLTSLSTYATLAIGLVALALTERGSRLANLTWRSARLKARPSEGTCLSRTWENSVDGPLHLCTSAWMSQCHDKFHVKGEKCWEDSLLTVLNSWNQNSLGSIADKPEILPLSKDFLKVDLQILLAFVFMAAEGKRPDEKRVYSETSKVKFCGVEVEVQTIGQNLLLLHLKGKLHRSLTKSYMDCLLAGYPPLLQDPRNTSILKKDDEARGGWVAALGLQENYTEDGTFLPVYLDCVRYENRRGGVFWRSMDRVQLIITAIWAPAFASDPQASKDISRAITALEYIHKYETESGVHEEFDTSSLGRPLSPEEKTRIINHFNGPPRIAVNQQHQFRATWRPLLPHVLDAALDGSVRCIAYFKNPCRELDIILPMQKLKSSELFVRGC